MGQMWHTDGTLSGPSVCEQLIQQIDIIFKNRVSQLQCQLV